MSTARVAELFQVGSQSTAATVTNTCTYAWNFFESAWGCIASQEVSPAPSSNFTEQPQHTSGSWYDTATYVLLAAGLLAAARFGFVYAKSRYAPRVAPVLLPALVPSPAPLVLVPAKKADVEKKVAPKRKKDREKTVAERFQAIAYDDEKIPKLFLCNIMQAPMTDPVVAVDGHLYERKVIEKYLATKEQDMDDEDNEYVAIVSPMDNKTEIDRSLIPVKGLKSDISTLIDGLERPYYSHVRSLFADRMKSENTNSKEEKANTSEKQLSDIVNLIKKY